jgi:hydrogenase maturation protein HypF
MLLETLCRVVAEPIELPLVADAEGIWRTDWEPLLDVIGDVSRDRPDRAEVFHSTMAHAILQQARQARAEHDISQVGLCGGVFQNRVLTEQAVELLESDGFRVRLPLLLPCNDAALSYGQAAEFAASQMGG